MRNLVIGWALLVALLVACGPSGREVALAKQARFTGDKLVLFNTAKEVVKSKYELQIADETQLGMQTTARWYNPEGQAVGANMDNLDAVPDQSLRIMLVVELLPEGESNYIVAVKPVIARWSKGSPQPQPLKPGDISLPGWVMNRVDQLQFDIYEALKPYEVKTAGPAVAPAPAAS